MARKPVEESWRRRENWARKPSFVEKNGGGAGSCTRVRKYLHAGIYDAYPPLNVAPGVKGRQNRRAPVPENLAVTVQDDR